MAGVVAHQDGAFMQSPDDTFSHGALSDRARCEHLTANPSEVAPAVSKIVVRKD